MANCGQEELYTIGVFSGEFWDVHTPIKDGRSWRSMQIGFRLDMESLSIWDGVKQCCSIEKQCCSICKMVLPMKTINPTFNFINSMGG